VVGGVMHELHEWKIKGVVRVNGDLMAADFLADLNAGRNRGVLLIGNYSPDLAQFIEQCQQPLVLVDMVAPARADAVIIDNYGGVAAAVQHLVALGHREIAYLGVPGNPNYHERRLSFVASMVEAGLSVRPEWINEGPSLVESATARVNEILRRASAPTALVCCNDFVALGAQRAAEQIGVRVPEDLSIVGFDDVVGASFMSPPLTTVRAPTEELGRCAVRQLVLRAFLGDRPKEAPSEMRIKTQLIVRQSTGAPGSGRRRARRSR
jgi:DNA-binding LacI/PurR family transcriptional regulator